MNSEILSVALTSSLVAGVVSVLCTGAFNLWSLQQQYKNEYYKKIIERRIAAYENLELLVTNFKTLILGDDQNPYHWVFASDDSIIGIHGVLAIITAKALWISADAFKKSQQISRILFSLPNDEAGRIQFGKDNYKQLAIIRDELEIIIARDALELYKVHKFLASKVRHVSGFELISLRKP